MLTEITLPAHAKINLTLDVGERRPDGYHEIRSVMQTIGLHDTLTVGRTPGHPGISLDVVGEEAGGVPADETNLVHQAATRLQELAAARGFLHGSQSGLQIRLEKRIPSQAGLGGGSSDAAATLCAAEQLFSLNLSLPELRKIATTLGADVPFFLTGGTTLVEGLGERVTPLPPLAPDWDLVIVKPSIGISTSWAYGALDAQFGRTPSRATAAWLTGRHIPRNDFMPVAMSLPEIAAVCHSLRDADPVLCGSGAALFCRVKSQEKGRILARRVQDHDLGKTWMTRTVGVTG